MSGTDSRDRPTRLHLGASRLELLAPDVRPVFADASWIHLGDDEDTAPTFTRAPLGRRAWEAVRSGGVGALARGLVRSVRARMLGPGASVRAMYEQTDFRPFFYRRGDTLPFRDSSFGYIYSEHFFEHLAPEDAQELFRECARVLCPAGVIRTCVPDADLRTYEPPEPHGFPDPDMPADHPAKHKSRWSVYSLTAALESTGLRAVPLRFCDREGTYTRDDPHAVAAWYGPLADPEMVLSLNHVMRLDSLIIDGVKPGSESRTPAQPE